MAQGYKHCLCWGLGFSYQHTHGSSQLSVAPVPGSHTLFQVSFDPRHTMVHKHACWQNTQIKYRVLLFQVENKCFWTGKRADTGRNLESRQLSALWISWERAWRCDIQAFPINSFLWVKHWLPCFCWSNQGCVCVCFPFPELHLISG